MARRKKEKEQSNRRNKQPEHQEHGLPDEAAPSSELEVTKNYLHKKPLWAIFLLGSFLYANTISFEYVLDDKLAITHNEFTKKGIDGIYDLLSNDMFVGFYGRQKNLVEGGRYRPLSMVMFAIEWELFPNQPWIGHLLNALFYGFTGIVLFLVLCKLFPPENQKWFFSLPFVIAALYITHPLHTEVVANIKSRDEIISTLCGFSCLLFALRYIQELNPKLLLFSFGLFFLCLSSKESGAVFLGVIPLTLVFFPHNNIRNNLIAMAPLIVATVIYFGIRSMVLGDMIKDEVAAELMNKPFMHASENERLATILFTMAVYIKLLVFPHPLTHDYYPWHPIAEDSYKWGNGFPYLDFTDTGVLLSLGIYTVLAVFGLFGLYKMVIHKKPNMFAYGTLLYLGTFVLFSNIFFDIGAFMNERFMYIPSLGFCIVLGYFVVEKLPQWIKSEALRTGIFLAILVAYSGKTFTRNFAWESDFTLSVTDVEVSNNSAKVNMSAGGSLVDRAKLTVNPTEKKKMLVKAVNLLNRSLELYPGYIQPMLLMGNARYELGEYENAIFYFENCLKINPTYNFAVNNLLHIGDTATRAKRFEIAIKSYGSLLKYNPKHVRALSKIGEVYGKHLGDLNSASKFLNQAYSIDSNNTDVIQKLGVVYAMTNQSAKAIAIFNRALKSEPDNAHIMMNLGITYTNTGETEKGEKLLKKAFEIDPTLKPN